MAQQKLIFDSKKYRIINDKYPVNICDICDNKWKIETLANVECYFKTFHLNINNIKKYIIDTDCISIEYLIKMTNEICQTIKLNFCQLVYSFPIFKIKHSNSKYNIKYDITTHYITNDKINKIQVTFNVIDSIQIKNKIYPINATIICYIDNYNSILNNLELIYSRSIKELQKNINIDSDKKIITNLNKLICLNINNYKSQIFKYDIEIECGELKSMLRKYL